MRIESKVSKTILEEAVEYNIGGVVIKAAPPSTATLIKVSEEASKLPIVNTEVNNLVTEVLRVAKNCKPLGNIAAYLLIGTKGAQTVKKSILWGLVSYRKRITVRRLSELILSEPPSFLSSVIVERLDSMEVADFFGITTSLAGVNLLKPTKERKMEEVV